MACKPHYLYMIPTLMFTMLASSLTTSILPGLVNNYFGKNSLFIVCFTGGLSAVIGVVGVPLFGSWSDTYGRKPLLILATLCSIPPMVSLYVSNNLWIFEAATVISAAGNAILTISMAYVADVTSKDHRDTAFGILIGSLGLSFIFGPTIGTFIRDKFGGDKTVFLSSIILTLLGILFIYFVVPESNTRDKKHIVKTTFDSIEKAIPSGKKTRSTSVPTTSRSSSSITGETFTNDNDRNNNKNSHDNENENVNCGNFISLYSKLQIILKNKILCRLTILSFAASMNESVVIYMISTYMTRNLHFTSEELSAFFMLMGTGLMVSQMLLLPLVMHWFKESPFSVIYVAISLTGIRAIALGFASTKLEAALSSLIGLTGLIYSPILQSLVTKHSDPNQIGTVQGIVAAITGVGGAIVAQGLGGMFLFLKEDQFGIPYIISGSFVLLVVAGNVVESLFKTGGIEPLEVERESAAMNVEKNTSHNDLREHLINIQ